ncbi:hypothetical protein F5877DRAFT_79923 [Lentinula edodes]|nr:hypothetical protein F5877DRAFT_79923 [Lentinula edodes]
MPSLEYGTHSLMIQNGVANGTDALILLDYIVYTADDGLESTTPGPQIASSLSAKNFNSRNFLAIVTAVPIGIALLLGVASFSLWRRHRLRQFEVHRQTLQVHPSYLSVEHGHAQSPRAQKHSSRGWSEGSTSVGTRSPREELPTSTTSRIVEILPPPYRATA